MIKVFAVAVGRSIADWASRVSAVMVNHSAGSRLEVVLAR